MYIVYILLTKTTAAQNEVRLSYYKVRELYFLAVVFAAGKVIMANIGTITKQFNVMVI